MKSIQARQQESQVAKLKHPYTTPMTSKLKIPSIKKNIGKLTGLKTSKN
jgi:hypothetical protein